MSETAVLYKVLEVKEQEKQEAQLERVKAVEKFEHIANQLYEQLKEKEDAEEHLNVEMKATFTIDKMINQTQYINILANKIINLQFHVQQARNKMETAQDQLNEAHIEVKKIEKMIEIREDALEAEARTVEATMMDEMSIKQYNKQIQNG
ncbi:MAG TPA: flagellar export protein FliJ [Pseudogracilibacillus sp.]|nr:flagellar export protein FliJ [Pseudogracilibacillus sp.]